MKPEPFKQSTNYHRLLQTWKNRTKLRYFQKNLIVHNQIKLQFNLTMYYKNNYWFLDRNL